MIKEINLLPKRRKQSEQEQKRIAILQTIAGVVLFFVLGSSLVLFFLQNNPDYNSLQTQQKTLQTQFLTYADQSSKIFVIHDRVTYIQEILRNRTSLDKLIAKAGALVPSNVIVTSLTVDKKSLSMAVSSPSLTSLNMFLEALSDSLDKKDLIKRFTISDVNVNAESTGYTVIVTGDLL